MPGLPNKSHLLPPISLKNTCNFILPSLFFSFLVPCLLSHPQQMDRAVFCGIVETLFYSSLTSLYMFLPLLHMLSLTFGCQIVQNLFPQPFLSCTLSHLPSIFEFPFFLSVLTEQCPQVNVVVSPRPTCGSRAKGKPHLVLHLSNVPPWNELAFVPVPPVWLRILPLFMLGSATRVFPHFSLRLHPFWGGLSSAGSSF